MTAGIAHGQVASTSLWRIGFFFAAYFASVGIFAPYFPLYLEHRGLKAAQIGVVLAMGRACALLDLTCGVISPTARRIDWRSCVGLRLPRRRVLWRCFCREDSYWYS